MDEKGFDGINVIPFIDIMLVLLVIVLTTATFIAAGALPIDLPRADAPAMEASRTLQVEIDRGGALFFAGVPIELSALRAELLACDRELPVVVRADRAVALQVFVDVMSLVRELGFVRVSLLTERGG